jgi:Brp/Blh family beta-carotene 15,15'-monooxygenase
MGLTEGVSGQTARTALGRASLFLGWVPLGALVLIALLVPTIPEPYRYLPIVASVVVFGLPHGAVDYVALPRARYGRVDLRAVAVVSLLYLVFGGLYLGLWILAPVLAAALFIGITWFHWGQGDLYALRKVYSVDHVDDFTQQALTVVVRGGLPMLVPLFGFPGRYQDVVDTFVAPFGGHAGSWLVFDPWPRLVLMAAFGLLTILALARGWTRATDRRGWRLDTTECALLWIVFLTVPPVVAVGVYFCLWHSVRHIVRVLLLDAWAVDAVAEHRFGHALGKFGLEAAVPTVLALAFVWVLLWATGVSPTDVAGATGLYLVAIAVLTLPHTLVVVALDRAQHVWSRPRDHSG